MSNLIAVVGDSGQGKSTSIEYLTPDETFIVNIGGKPLPFRGWKKKYIPFKEDKEKGNYIETSDPVTIGKVLAYVNAKRLDIKNVILDDGQYITAFELLGRALEKGWDKYTEIASHFFDVLKAAKDMREDLNVICMFHDELEEQESGTNKRIIKTSSRFIKEKLKPEGLFTYVFFTDVFVSAEDDKVNYTFLTNDGINSSAKTPRGCFEDRNIPNDLQFIVEKINEYNEG